MRHAIRLAVFLAVVAASLSVMPPVPAPSHASSGPLDTPTTMVRFYFHALDTHQCDLASKFAAKSSRSLSAFRHSCRAIRRIKIDQLTDPGYRLHPQTAAYTCLAIQYTVYREGGAATFGGWYLMERTLGPAWHILFARSHLTRGGSAIRLTKTECASHLPSYVHPGSGTVISGDAFVSPAAGWIALSTSGSYAPNGSCSHGIGSNCETAPTTVYRTDDAGAHWSPVLHFTAGAGPPMWVRLFSRQIGLVVATVSPLTGSPNEHDKATIFSTHDGGRHWQRFALPLNYVTENGTISFPDPRHGWLWYGEGAMGSMSVYVYRTVDGGRHWNRVACTAFGSAVPGYGCPHQEGIALGGDKSSLTFKDAHDGWLEAEEHSGVPDIYHTADGGASWQRQAVGLPPGVAPPTVKRQIFPSGTLLQPSFFGQIGLLPEEVTFYRPKPRATWDRLYVFRSLDGGRTWPSALRTPATASINPWQAIDAHDWLFVSDRTIWSTGNGGASWVKHPLHLPASLSLVSIDLVTPRSGWATAQTHADAEVSPSGTILLHTTDGGKHWTEMKLP